MEITSDYHYSLFNNPCRARLTPVLVAHPGRVWTLKNVGVGAVNAKEIRISTEGKRLSFLSCNCSMVAGNALTFKIYEAYIVPAGGFPPFNIREYDGNSGLVIASNPLSIISAKYSSISITGSHVRIECYFQSTAADVEIFTRWHN